MPQTPEEKDTLHQAVVSTDPTKPNLVDLNPVAHVSLASKDRMYVLDLGY